MSDSPGKGEPPQFIQNMFALVNQKSKDDEFLQTFFEQTSKDVQATKQDPAWQQFYLLMSTVIDPKTNKLNREVLKAIDVLLNKMMTFSHPPLITMDDRIQIMKYILSRSPPVKEMEKKVSIMAPIWKDYKLTRHEKIKKGDIIPKCLAVTLSDTSKNESSMMSRLIDYEQGPLINNHNALITQLEIYPIEFQSSKEPLKEFYNNKSDDDDNDLSIESKADGFFCLNVEDYYRQVEKSVQMVYHTLGKPFINISQFLKDFEGDKDKVINLYIKNPLFDWGVRLRNEKIKNRIKRFLNWQDIKRVHVWCHVMCSYRKKIQDPDLRRMAMPFDHQLYPKEIFDLEEGYFASLLKGTYQIVFEPWEDWANMFGPYVSYFTDKLKILSRNLLCPIIYTFILGYFAYNGTENLIAMVVKTMIGKIITTFLNWIWRIILEKLVTYITNTSAFNKFMDFFKKFISWISNDPICKWIWSYIDPVFQVIEYASSSLLVRVLLSIMFMHLYPTGFCGFVLWVFKQPWGDLKDIFVSKEFDLTKHSIEDMAADTLVDAPNAISNGFAKLTNQTPSTSTGVPIRADKLVNFATNIYSGLPRNQDFSTQMVGLATLLHSTNAIEIFIIKFIGIKNKYVRGCISKCLNYFKEAVDIYGIVMDIWTNLRGVYNLVQNPSIDIIHNTESESRCIRQITSYLSLGTKTVNAAANLGVGGSLIKSFATEDWDKMEKLAKLQTVKDKLEELKKKKLDMAEIDPFAEDIIGPKKLEFDQSLPREYYTDLEKLKADIHTLENTVMIITGNQDANSDYQGSVSKIENAMDQFNLKYKLRTEEIRDAESKIRYEDQFSHTIADNLIHYMRYGNYKASKALDGAYYSTMDSVASLGQMFTGDPNKGSYYTEAELREADQVHKVNQYGKFLKKAEEAELARQQTPEYKAENLRWEADQLEKRELTKVQREAQKATDALQSKVFNPEQQSRIRAQSLAGDKLGRAMMIDKAQTTYQNETNRIFDEFNKIQNDLDKVGADLEQKKLEKLKIQDQIEEMAKGELSVYQEFKIQADKKINSLNNQINDVVQQKDNLIHQLNSKQNELKDRASSIDSHIHSATTHLSNIQANSAKAQADIDAAEAQRIRTEQLQKDREAAVAQRKADLVSGGIFNRIYGNIKLYYGDQAAETYKANGSLPEAKFYKPTGVHHEQSEAVNDEKDKEREQQIRAQLEADVMRLKASKAEFESQASQTNTRINHLQHNRREVDGEISQAEKDKQMAKAQAKRKVSELDREKGHFNAQVDDKYKEVKRKQSNARRAKIDTENAVNDQYKNKEEQINSQRDRLLNIDNESKMEAEDIFKANQFYTNLSNKRQLDMNKRQEEKDRQKLSEIDQIEAEKQAKLSAIQKLIDDNRREAARIQLENDKRKAREAAQESKKRDDIFRKEVIHDAYMKTIERDQAINNSREDQLVQQNLNITKPDFTLNRKVSRTPSTRRAHIDLANALRKRALDTYEEAEERAKLSKLEREQLKAKQIHDASLRRAKQSLDTMNTTNQRTSREMGNQLLDIEDQKRGELLHFENETAINKKLSNGDEIKRERLESLDDERVRINEKYKEEMKRVGIEVQKDRINEKYQQDALKVKQSMAKSFLTGREKQKELDKQLLELESKKNAELSRLNQERFAKEQEISRIKADKEAEISKLEKQSQQHHSNIAAMHQEQTKMENLSRWTKAKQSRQQSKQFELKNNEEEMDAITALRKRALNPQNQKNPFKDKNLVGLFKK
jgi:hypothetical protein